MTLKARIRRLRDMIFGQSRGMYLFNGSKRDYAAKAGDLGKSSVVMAPVLWIMRNLSSAPIVIEDPDGEQVDDHEMLDLLKRPNKFYGGRTLMMAVAHSLSIDGNAYIIKVRDSRRRVRELWFVPYWLMEPWWPQDGSEYIKYYKYMPDGREIYLDVDDVIHVRYGLDPENQRKGLSPFKSLLKEVFTDTEAATFAASVLYNGGVPGMVISPKEKNIAQGDVDSIKDYVNKKFTGDHRGEPMVLSAPTEVSEFGFSPDKMDLGKLRNIPEERVTAVLGVSAAIIGFGTGLQQTKVGATLEAYKKTSYENGVIPQQELIADELETSLLPDFEADPSGMKVRFDLSGVQALQEDRNKIFERLTNAVQGGWLTVSEAQRMAGFDVDESQNVYLRGVQLVQTPAQKMRTKSLDREGDEFQFPDNASDAEIAFMRQLTERVTQVENNWINEQVDRFNELGDRVADLWLAESQKKSLEDEVNAERVVDNLDWEEVAAVALAYQTLYLGIARETAEAMRTTMAVAVNLTDPMEANILSKAGIREGLIDLKQQTKDAMFRAIREGRELGEGVDQIARRIRDEIPKGTWRSSRTRAQVIARTEGRYAQNISTIEMGKEAGAVAYRVFDCQLGCDEPHTDTGGISCSGINGETVRPDDVEYLSSVEHPNGTRDFVPIFDPDVEITFTV